MGTQTVNGEAVTIAAYNSGNGELSIAVDDASTDAATMQLLIASIRYTNVLVAPDGTDRSITFSVTDNADNPSPEATTTMSVSPPNAAPTLAGGPASLNGTATNGTSSAKQVSSLISGVTYGDTDGLATTGVAITATTGAGVWQFSTDNSTWTDFPAVTVNAALLLDSASYIRFRANASTGSASLWSS